MTIAGLNGHALMTDALHIRGSAWINFPRVLCECWSHNNIVLMGDAAATAQLSIGSGTKFAFARAGGRVTNVNVRAARSKPFKKTTLEQRQPLLAVNLTGLFLTVKARTRLTGQAISISGGEV